MNKMMYLVIILLTLSCTGIQERLAIKECKFSLFSVTPYDFQFSDLKIDFEIKADNPNNVDAILDKLTYDFYVNETQVFSGTTGQGIKIPAGKSKNFTTTTTLQYSKIGEAILEAIKFQNAAYKVTATVYIRTIIGEMSYPVEIKLK